MLLLFIATHTETHATREEENKHRSKRLFIRPIGPTDAELHFVTHVCGTARSGQCSVGDPISLPHGCRCREITVQLTHIIGSVRLVLGRY